MEICIGTPRWMGSNMVAGNQLTETPVKSVNLSLEKRKKTKRIRFLIHELLNCQILRNKSLFNQHDSSLGRHVNAESGKSLEIQA